MAKLSETRPDVARRFATFVEPAADGCARWIGMRVQGVPRFTYAGTVVPARKVALLLAGRRIPARAKFRTRCGDPLCVALEHVLVVTPAPKRPKAVKKILDPQTRALIRRMRQSGVKIREVAKACGCDRSTVSKIAGPLRRPAPEPVALRAIEGGKS
ncbi:MAG: helix-turn-helix domain-containing protein [bacterium]|nr:helix-turn-helix domain-containing protein [bacterium]